MINVLGNVYRLEVKGIYARDVIIRIAPLHMGDADALTVTWDVDIVGGVNGEETSRVTDRAEATFRGAGTVQFVRHITSPSGKSVLRVYDELPEDVSAHFELAAGVK